MKLRPYQQKACSAALVSLADEGNPVLQLATGTGKSLIIAAIAEHFKMQNKRVWVLTHIQQLVKQNAKTFQVFTGGSAGIVCAGLDKKETRSMVTYATIQSIIGVLDEIPDPDFIFIDEAHRVPHNEGGATLYASILNRYPKARRAAFTATPWRMDNGIIYGDGDHFWFDNLAFKYTVPEAVDDGWLCPLIGVETAHQLNIEDVNVNNDFVQSEIEDLQIDEWLESVARSILELASQRKHIAVYCPTIFAAMKTSKIINKITGWETDFIAGNINTVMRDYVLGKFESGKTRVLCSVDMITTGFDFPALDCLVVLRPTLSSSLWVQIQGRGTRLHESKKNCLILDFVGNLQRLGGVDMYETYYRQALDEDFPVELPAVPTKPYVRKERIFYPGVRTIKPIDPMTGLEATDNSIILAKVSNVNCVALPTRKNPTQPVVLVQYACVTPEGARIDGSTFINTENPKQSDIEFFKRRHLAVNLPTLAKSLSWQLKNARQPVQVSLRKSGKYWNVVEEYFGELNDN